MNSTSPAGSISRTSADSGIEPWIGADVDQKTFAAALYIDPQRGVPDLKAFPVRRFERSSEGVARFLQWTDSLLARHRPAAGAPRLCMESTGRYSAELAVELLRQRPAMAPAIVNARYIKKFGESLGQRCKADKADARVCAVFGADRCPQPWSEPQYRKLRELCRERQALVAQQTALSNRRAGQGRSDALVEQIQRQLRGQLERHIAKLDRAIEREIGEIPELAADARQVRQIPGVGSVVTAAVFAELGDLRAYRRGRSLSAMAGLNPAVVESGASKGKTRMSKKGNARVRGLLFCAAMGCLRTKDDHCLKRLYQRMIARGKSRMQALGALMRRILLLMRALLITGKPFDPDHDLRGKNGRIGDMIRTPHFDPDHDLRGKNGDNPAHAAHPA